MPYYIAFDIAMKPRGKIDENYTELRDFLNANDFVCYNFLEIPITQESLKPYDILVFVCPDFAKISSQEISEIENWVREDGGGLLLLSHAGGDKGRNSNLSELSERFGIVFENDQVLDEQQNIGMENLPIVTTFIPPHPITEGIESICYRAGCSLSVLGGNAFSIASSNETSEPFSCPLICVAEAGNGRVCAIGSYEMFRDRIGGGFSHPGHSQLALNIFKWLISDYRAELRSQGVVSLPTSATQASQAQNITSYSNEGSLSYPPSTSVSVPTIESINSKEDLINFLSGIINQIDILRTTVNNLINAIQNSDFGFGQISQEISESPYQYTSMEQGITESESEKKQEIEPLFGLSSEPLSELPPKPPTLLKKIPSISESEIKAPQSEQLEAMPPTADDFAEAAKIAAQKESEVKESKKVEEEVKAETSPEIDKEELLAELEALESKLNSYFNLMSFIEKKYSSGGMKEAAYKKQTSKLKKDIDKTKKRISEIKNIIEG